MLQWINDRMKVFGWIILLPLSLVFAVWGVQGIVSFTSQQDRGLKVNGEQAPVEQMRLAYQERSVQLTRAFPEQIPA
ncbi:MAG: SurA N-terminal domain-containing protein, partial [Proteobacteria bacterium]|nr:SurA N-terminal domain-containing protein [Pseudomonadota bacterium]